MDTWPKILKANAENYGSGRKAMRYKHYGIWQSFTWERYYLEVKHLALGLSALGFSIGDKLLIIGDNAPQRYCAELAAQSNHGVAVGAYADSTADEIKYIAVQSEARFAVVQDQEQVDKLLAIKSELPLLTKIIYWNYKGLAHYTDQILVQYGTVIELGRQHEKERPGFFEDYVKTGRADDVCAIVYTSGTTGTRPKGAVHTFATMKAGADCLMRLGEWKDDDNIVPHLPPDWMIGQWSAVGCHLLIGCTLNLAEEPETLLRDAKEVEPSIVLYGARVWEGRAAALQARMLGVGGVKKAVYRRFMDAGYRTADLRLQQRKPTLHTRFLYALGDLLFFGPFRRSLGLGQARICYSTDSAVSPDARRFFYALGVPLRSIYSTTEGGVLADAGSNEVTLDTVIAPFKDSEISISDTGEIVYRQPSTFIGYCNDPEMTSMVLRQGWFHTGDSATVAGDGNILFLDRTVNLVDLAGGQRLAPQLLEARLRFSPYIKDAWVFSGAGKQSVAAIIVINYANVSRWAGYRNISFNTYADLSQTPEVYDLIKDEVTRVNSSVQSACRIMKYVNLHRELDPDGGEVTRNRNLRRNILEKRFAEIVRAMNDGRDTASIDIEIERQDGHTETRKGVLIVGSVEGAGS